MRSNAILGASPFTGNKGVDALLSGTLESINRTGSEAIVLDYVKKPDEKPSHFARHACLKKIIALRFSWRLNLPNNIFRLLIKVLICRTLSSKRSQNSIFQNDPWLAPIFNTSAAVAISGGDSFSDIYGFRRLLYVSLPQILALSLKKPLIILPQTIGPFKSKRSILLARYILNSAHLVYARDKTSLALAKQLVDRGGPSVRLSRDMAFALQPEKATPDPMPGFCNAESEQPIVAINASGLMMMGGYSKDNAFGLQFDYETLLLKLSKWLIAEKGCKIALISHVTQGAENDQSACLRIFEKLEPEFPGKIQLIDHNLDEAEIKHVIGRCSFLYGSRMHACIAALSQGIPAVGLSYSRKFKGVYETIGSESLVVELGGQEIEEILVKCHNLFEDREAHKRRLIPQAEKARQEALSLFSSLELETERRLESAPAI